MAYNNAKYLYTVIEQSKGRVKSLRKSLRQWILNNWPMSHPGRVNACSIQANELWIQATKRSAISGFSMGINLFIAQGIVYGVVMYAGLRFAEKGWISFDDVMGAFFGVFTGGMGL